MKQTTKDDVGVVFIRANLSARIKKEKPNAYVSYCPELDLYSQGDTLKEAEANIIEATQLFIESCIERNTLREVLLECGFTEYSQPIKKQRSKPAMKFVGEREVKFPASIPLMHCA